MPLFAGTRQLSVHDETQDIHFPVLVVYPTASSAAPTPFGPYLLEVSPDAPIAKGRFPLIVISHGSGGSHLLYRTIALHLARHGYVVALPEHHRNNRLDNSLYGTVDNLVNRPYHVQLVLNAIAADPLFGPQVDSDNAAVIGHSMGGYTALAVAGGKPWSKEGLPVEIASDPRVRALVLLAPATAWFKPEDSLKQVTLPILMLIGEHDDITPQWHADLVLDQVPDRTRVICRVIENAGHFSFLSPFPPKLLASGLPPALDPEGFDRETFHEHMPEEIRHFLDQHLKPLG
jgi:predicted dienelactone hydrolase